MHLRRCIAGNGEGEDCYHCRTGAHTHGTQAGEAGLQGHGWGAWRQFAASPEVQPPKADLIPVKKEEFEDCAEDEEACAAAIDWNDPQELAIEHELAIKHGVKWQHRGPPAPEHGGPSVWRNQTYRHGLDGGKTGWKVRGGRAAAFYRAKYGPRGWAHGGEREPAQQAKARRLM